jgi:hypothetical protein
MEASEMEPALIQEKIKCFERIITPNLGLSIPAWLRHLISRKDILKG